MIKQKNSSRYIATDCHSRLNSITHDRRILVEDITDIEYSVKTAKAYGKKLIACGGRHAMGGQQFVDNGWLLDFQEFNSIIWLDSKKGLVKAQAGATFDKFLADLALMQIGQSPERRWSITQKPTGADSISLAGCVSSNIHGRGLDFAPFVNDIESLEIVDATGELISVSRESNRELFGLICGGYGLFGIIATVTLRLRKVSLLKRVVQVINSDLLLGEFHNAIKDGHIYGDFQFSIDSSDNDFLDCGILSTYSEQNSRDISQAETVPESISLSMEDWSELNYLAHFDKKRAFIKYRDHYLKTGGQLYWSDTMQLSTYKHGYHEAIDIHSNRGKGSEMITELYVEKNSLPELLEKLRFTLRIESANIIYGTIRLIRPDTETFLPWARENAACLVLNLHIDHNKSAIEQAKRTLRKLIDCAIECQGRYYLTYHRFATGEQLLRCYPEINDFFELKLEYDPDEIFYSSWYQHQKSIIHDQK